MTKESLTESIEKHFGSIPDKRVVIRSDHKLVDIIAIAILGIMCGADGWVAIETYGKAKEEWLKTLDAANHAPFWNYPMEYHHTIHLAEYLAD